MKKEERDLISVSCLLKRYFRDRNRMYDADREVALWGKISRNLNRKRRLQHFVRYGMVAASVVILVSTGIYYFNGQRSVPDMEQIADAFDAQMDLYRQGSDPMVLRGDEHITVGGQSGVAYSETGDLNVNDKQYVARKGEKERFNHLIVPYGRNVQMMLSDGSKIWVNAGSHLVYPETFGKDERRIYVDGEVYLEVVRDEKRPFIVSTSGFEVDVLGTVFNVCNYKERTDASVVLVSGSVEVCNRAKETLPLLPDERVEISLGNIGEKQKVAVSDYISWIDNVLICRGEPLDKVFQRLEHHYGMKFYYNKEKIETVRISGKLDLKPTVGEVLSTLALMTPISWKQEDNVIYIENIELNLKAYGV